MFTKIILLAALLGTTAATSCLNCICNVESGCKPIGCEMDVGSLSCGYYQIKLPYYEDCGEPGKRSGESTETAWKRCADEFSCATTCVENYAKRYAFECPEYGSCERTARIHNGGPRGCQNSGTVGYWDKVKACCGCS
uniref:lysozyme n=1 Tax=Parastrongyloides trichosuri TaxID=131310 RepID=A0A0N4ZAJ4_PARTI